MSFIGSMFSGSQGAGYQGGGAGILNPATVQQANTAYDQTQQGLQQQQAFLQALQSQNGIQNQSNVFNQLQGVANGTGPNPAQAQLAQATGANTANQAALMAGQRGAGSNVGLIARQAAQQGAANQQNLAGQAATLQANQSLNALNQLSGIAGQQVGQQANAVQGYNQAAQGQQANILGAIQGQNQANVGMQSNINNVNSTIANTNAQNQAKLFGGLTSGALSFLAGGGEVQNYAIGGITEGDNQSAALNAMNANTQPTSGPRSSFAQYLQKTIGGGDKDPQPVYDMGESIAKGIGNGIKSIFGGSNAPTTSTNAGANQISTNAITGPDATQMPTMNAAKGGPVKAMLSPGEKYLNPNEAQQVAQGKKDVKSAGKMVPGKAKVPGDSLKNDTVPATLEEGGFVISRSHMKSPGTAAAFVRAHLSTQDKLRGKK